MLENTISLFSTTTTTISGSGIVEGAAFLGAMFGVFLTFGLIFAVLTIIAYWKIFEKAGEKGWKILIPIYNVYMMYKIVKMKNWFWALLFISVASSIIMTIDGTSNIATMSNADLAAFDWSTHPSTIGMLIVELIFGVWASILFAWRTAKVFGHGIGYTIGLLFVPNIFWLILGFSKDKYDKKRLKK